MYTPPSGAAATPRGASAPPAPSVVIQPCLGLGHGVRDGMGVEVPERETVVANGTPLGSEDDDAVRDDDGVAAERGDAVEGVLADNGAPVADGNAVPVTVVEAVAITVEPVRVPLRLPVAQGVALTDAVPLGVPLVEQLPEGLRSDAMLRPRYVSRATAASGVSPLPLTAPPVAASQLLIATSVTSDDTSELGTSCVTLANRKQGAAGASSAEAGASE